MWLLTHHVPLTGREGDVIGGRLRIVASCRYVRRIDRDSQQLVIAFDDKPVEYQVGDSMPRPRKLFGAPIHGGRSLFGNEC